MSRVRRVYEQAKVLARSYVTYATIASAAVAALVGALTPFSDVPRVGGLLNVLVAAAGVLAASVAIVRRVTEVPAELRGVLLPEDTVDESTDDGWDDWKDLP